MALRLPAVTEGVVRTIWTRLVVAAFAFVVGVAVAGATAPPGVVEAPTVSRAYVYDTAPPSVEKADAHEERGPPHSTLGGMPQRVEGREAVGALGAVRVCGFGVAANSVKWVDEGGDLRAGSPSMSKRAYDYQSGAPGARSNPATGRGMAPQLEMPGADGSTVTARFDGVEGSEIIDRKLNPVFSSKAVAQARRQAGVAAYNGYQAVWELPTPQAVAAANRFMDYAGVSSIIVRQAP